MSDQLQVGKVEFGPLNARVGLAWKIVNDLKVKALRDLLIDIRTDIEMQRGVRYYVAKIDRTFRELGIED